MITHNELTWTDEGRGSFSAAACGVALRVEGDRFDVCLPDGSHVSGPGGKAEAFSAFADYVLRRVIKDNLVLRPESLV